MKKLASLLTIKEIVPDIGLVVQWRTRPYLGGGGWGGFNPPRNIFISLN